MKRWITALTIVFVAAAADSARAQEMTPGPGKLEVSLIPGGFTFVTKKSSADLPDFRSYDAGAALAYNFTRVVGVEGEVVGAFGLKKTFDEIGFTTKESAPNRLGYTANVVAMLPGRSIVPYATGGIGGNTLFKREVLDIFKSDTFFTGNVGGGVKWYAPGNRWGLRGDYRFEAIKSKDNAPEFFGNDNRFSHRVYGAVVINAVK